MNGTCTAFITVDGPETGGRGGVLACWLTAGHDGAHFDEPDRVYWYTSDERVEHTDD